MPVTSCSDVLVGKVISHFCFPQNKDKDGTEVWFWKCLKKINFWLSIMIAQMKYLHRKYIKNLNQVIVESR